MLSKNEASGANPYNRHLFRRVAHGAYLLNPMLEVERQGTWVSVADAMGLPLVLGSLGARGEELHGWLERLRGSMAQHHAGPEQDD
jgi:hypothetical protein